MQQNEIGSSQAHLPTLVPAGMPTSVPVSSSQDEIETALSKVFNADLDDALGITQTLLEECKNDEAKKLLVLALEATWDLFKALELIQTQSDHTQAAELLQRAAIAYQNSGQPDLANVSIGLGAYSEAVVELYRLNVGRALQLLDNVSTYLRAEGRYNQKFEALVSHMEPDALFIAAAQALQYLDFPSGKALIQKAAERAAQVATKYHEEGSPTYNTFLGFGSFYKAFYVYFEAANALNRFEYDTLAARDLSSEAKRASELLRIGEQTATVVSQQYLASTLTLLLGVFSELATIMNRIFDSTFKPDLRTLTRLKGQVRQASDSASQLGSNGVVFVRACDQLITQLNNLERLAKPTKKDFGVFAGLIASALFLPLFLATSWANSQFSIGMGPKTLITNSLVLALIGGFGYGAVRFQSLITGGAKTP